MSFWVRSKKKNTETRHANSRSQAPSLRPPPPREAPEPKKGATTDGSSEVEEKKPFPNQKSSKANIEQLDKDIDLLDKEEEEWYAKHVQTRIRVGTVDGAPPAPEYAAPAPKRSFFRRFSAAPAPRPKPKPVAKQIEQEEPSSPPPVNLTPNEYDNQQYTVAFVKPNTTTEPLADGGETGGGTLDEEEETPNPDRPMKKKKSLFRENTDANWEDHELDELHTEMEKEMDRLKSMTATNEEIEEAVKEVDGEPYSDHLPEVQETFETPEVAPSEKEKEEPAAPPPMLKQRSSAFDNYEKKGTCSIEDSGSILKMTI
jgi:hypothetical protein